MRQAQKETVGLAKGGKPYQSTGVTDTPVTPTLAEAGIDKNLAEWNRQAMSSVSSRAGKGDLILIDLHFYHGDFQYLHLRANLFFSLW